MNKHRQFHLLLSLTHQWGKSAEVNLRTLHATCCARIALKRGDDLHSLYAEEIVYRELELLMKEYATRQKLGTA